MLLAELPAQEEAYAVWSYEVGYADGGKYGLRLIITVYRKYLI